MDNKSQCVGASPAIWPCGDTMSVDLSLFNRGIYLEEIGKHGDGFKYRLHMPDENGQLSPEFAKRKTGIVIQWPVNPHFTGANALAEMLNTQYQHGLVGGHVQEVQA